MSDIHIRALEPEEWIAFREIRLRALAHSPGAFFTSQAQAEALSDDAWRWMVAGENHQTFGLFDGEALVGVTGIVPDSTDESGETAVFVMSYIQPAYRNRGLSRLFYEARLAWARAHRRYRRVVVSHRASNVASMKANQRFGFRHIETVSHEWPDGIVEDDIRYELIL
jgi:RimJ/RimL family protein N-acetyltransferase